MIKTRFAPSPKEKLNIDNVRTALFACLYAKHTDGKFVLRIEDTNQEQSLPEYTEKLMKDLLWLGLDWDEGPKKGGPAGPYLQSERLPVYQEYAKKLIDEGRAYHCYCTPEEIEAGKASLTLKGKTPHYNGHCRHLTETQKKQFEKEGRKPSVRFMADEGDFVILRANGMPVYNFAAVIDDALMEITHVLSADEPLSNTARQSSIYKAFGFTVPVFGHIAFVYGKDHQKLSKRHDVVSVDELRSMGYLPDAVVNYLSLLGWSSPDGREILSREDLVKLFDIDRLSASPALFDNAKLDWIGKHKIINEKSDAIFQLALPFIQETGLLDKDFHLTKKNEAFLKGLVELTKGYCSHLSEIKSHIIYFLTDDFPLEEEARKILEREDSKKIIQKFYSAIQSENRSFTEEVFSKIFSQIMKETGIKGKNLFLPLRAALTGRIQGPEIYYLIPVIGKERTLKRLVKVMN
jgi:glutamyl/glutaminyl-tRNA synthetase